MTKDWSDVPMLGRVPTGAKKIGEDGDFDVYEYYYSVFKSTGKYPSNRDLSDDTTENWLEGIFNNVNKGYRNGGFEEEEQAALDVLASRGYTPIEGHESICGRSVLNKYSIPQFDYSIEPEQIRWAIDLLECVMIIRWAVEKPESFDPIFVASQGAHLGELRLLLDLKPLENHFKAGAVQAVGIKSSLIARKVAADIKAEKWATAYRKYDEAYPLDKPTKNISRVVTEFKGTEHQGTYPTIRGRVSDEGEVIPLPEN